ncbi:YggS family pyridoxal phosphate enzyme [Lacunimicrobium album]
MPSIAENVSLVREVMARACDRADRDPQTVRLLPVTKYVEHAQIQALIDLGFKEFGESRPQQLIARAQHFSTQIRWHQIGHLQRNKVKQLLPYISAIHSVDSIRLAEALSEASGKSGVLPEILLEINLSGEASKDGFAPDELTEAWPTLTALPHLKITGLMTMAAQSEDIESARPTFRNLRLLRDDLNTTLPDDRKLTQLSMGMSDDFPIAIEEGATIIRIGSRLFS